MSVESEITVLKNMVRVGTVSSVDVESRTVRVAFTDKQDTTGNPLISGHLKVIQNQPLITVEKWTTEDGIETKWGYQAEYNSHDRNIGIDESYVKTSYAGLKDVVKNETTIKYEKKATINGGSPITISEYTSVATCPIQGTLESKTHKQITTVYPWLPYVGQLVVCLYLPSGGSDGFVLGGI